MSKVKLSNPPSGPNVMMDSESYDRMIAVATFWQFSCAKEGFGMVVRVRPSRDGWKLGRSEQGGSTVCRISGGSGTLPEPPLGPPLHGVVEYDFDTVWRGDHLEMLLPRILPGPRVHAHAPKVQPDRRTVMLTFMGRDLTFSVPETELVDLVLAWTDAGYRERGR